ncbi:SDR family oxidoreductase [Agromyces sp. MMS24-JH15]|uniref:SDR family oxidoreductase n=1 Tax=Agromyces sp. MMS24-JH15 TaxID=3243765 RepID=UPI003747BCDC
MKIAVAGGTGLLGSRVVGLARERGHEVVVLARSAGIDLLGGDAAARDRLVAALAGVDAVIDVSNVTTLKADDAEAFFTATTGHLLAAEQAAGVAHHVALSIVGVDRAPYGYYAGKVAQERAVEAGAVPWTILRATQFHEFAGQMLDRLSVAGVHLAPNARTQPVAAGEVAARLVDLAEGEPAGRVPDLAGPREERLADMVRMLAKARGLRGPVVAVSLPGKQMQAMRRGDALPGPGAQLGSQSYDEWVRTDAAAVAS